MATAILNRRIHFFFTLLFVSVLGMSLVSCETMVSPKKLERKITVDSWEISNFVFDGENVQNEFTGTRLGFSENGQVIVLPSSLMAQGSWNPSLNKKPTLLYMSGFVTQPFFKLNDDWTVVSCSKETIKLESEVGGVKNKITLLKFEEED